MVPSEIVQNQGGMEEDVNLNLLSEPANNLNPGNFTDLICWQKCRDLRIELSLLVKSFPDEEKSRLSDQIIRASRSVTNNIAEGFGRFHYKESLKFYYFSRGSIAEIQDHLMIASEEGYISSDELSQFLNKLTEFSKILNGYIGFVVSKIKS